MALLHRYWYEFNISPGELTTYQSYGGLAWGCGVTAYSHEDAIAVLHERLFGEDPTPAIARVTEDIDVSTLDEGHVLPNIGIPTMRGVWFPAVG